MVYFDDFVDEGGEDFFDCYFIDNDVDFVSILEDCNIWEMLVKVIGLLFECEKLMMVLYYE